MTASKKKPTKARKPKDTKPAKLWFKVLLNGKSFHGSNFEWSLPANDKPGKWHAVPDSQPLDICRVGFHLTDRPGEWWSQGASFFIAEYDGEVTEYQKDGAKIACRKVRLLREATLSELASAGVFKDGEYQAMSGEKCLALANSTVTAWDNSTVTAWANSTVTAWDNSTVTARDNSTVTAWANSTVTALANSTVTARDNSTVTAWDNSTVTAWDNSTVTARDNSTVTALANSTVKSSKYHSGKIEAREKTTVIRRGIRAAISLFGCAVEIDWTKQTATMRTAS